MIAGARGLEPVSPAPRAARALGATGMVEPRGPCPPGTAPAVPSLSRHRGLFLER
jgi:hypothetical protein